MDRLSPPPHEAHQWITEASFWSPRHLVTSAWTEFAPFAFWLVQAIRPTVFVELGTHHGFSYLAFCQAVQRTGVATRCYAIDTWQGDEHAGFYGEEVFATLRDTNDQFYSAFSRLVRARFDAALRHFADGEIDLLHIDGRHRYEDVTEDYEMWRPKLSDCAIVLFHDINVREGDFGVWKFWQDIETAHPSFAFMHGHGLGLLAVGKNVPPGLRPLFECGPDGIADIRAAYARLGAAVANQARLDAVTVEVQVRGEQAQRLEEELRARDEQAQRLGEELRARDEQAQRLGEELRARDEQAQRLGEELRARDEQAQRLGEEFRRAESELVCSMELLANARVESARLREEVRALTRTAEELAEQNCAADALRREAIAAAQARAAMESKLNVSQSETQRLAHALHSIKSSFSWRATRPLRSIFSWLHSGNWRSLRRLARALRREVKPRRIAKRLRRLKAAGANARWTAATQGGGSGPSPMPRAETRAAVDQAALFDAAHYLGQLPAGTEFKMAPLDHYRQFGWRKNCNPHPLFDVRWYLEQNPDVRAAGVEPLEHYLQFGWREGRNPHPLVDLQWTLETNPELAAAGTEPLQHLSLVMPASPPAVTKRSWHRSEQQFGQEVPRVLPICYTPPGRTDFPELTDAEVRAELAEVDILSLDIFDTALLRMVGHPTSAFEILEEKLLPELGDAVFGFADVRFWAERAARRNAIERGRSQEIGLDDIYLVIRQTLGLTEADTTACKEKEVRLERDLLKSNPRTMQWAQTVLSLGKRVIFVSDMYLPARITAAILREQGYSSPEVYMSCDLGASKWEGNLYPIVAEKANVAGSRILHIGDNAASDVRCASAAGWRALRYEDGEDSQAFALQLSDGVPLPIEKIAVSAALGAARVHRLRVLESVANERDRLARLIGYEILGPTVLGFAGWMVTQSERDRLDQVLFLSRDGWLPYQAYQLICEARGRSCNAQYVWASRRLLNCARLKCRSDIAVHMPDFTSTTTVAEYADILGLTEQDLALESQRVHEPIWPSGNAAEYANVREQLKPMFANMAPLILHRAAEQRICLIKYLLSVVDIGNADKMGVVDLGWSGRLVAPLDNILREINHQLTLHAYFFGTGTAAGNIIPSGIPWASYFFHAKDPRLPLSPMALPDTRILQNVIGGSMSLIEVLIGANYTSIIGLKWNERTGASPIHALDSFTNQQRQFLSLAHESCLGFVRDTIPLLPDNPEKWDMRDVIAKGWGRLLLSPSVSEAEFLGSFPHRVDASGHAATTTIVSPADPADSGEDLWRQWSRSLWPAGWFAVLEPFLRARMLRGPSPTLNSIV